MPHIAIVGGGQAAIACCAKLRSLGFDGEISIFCAEGCAPYERPPLTKGFLAGESDRNGLYLPLDPDAADMHPSTPVTAIDPAKKMVTASDRRIAYDHLVLATGASPRRLPAAIGGELQGVHVVRTVVDSEALRENMRPGKKLLVIGGGYVGLEAAATAAERGLSVKVVEMGSRILQRVASAELSDFVRDLHQSHGVEIVEGCGIKRILGKRTVEGAVLADGAHVDADIVLLGIGAVPDTALAASSGIAVDNGIKTDAFGRTSQPNIWAAGDCASFPYDHGRIRLENVQNAIDQAELVAANILGENRAYRPVPTFWSDQYDRTLQMVGLSAPNARIVVRPTTNADGLCLWHYSDNRLIAAEMAGEPKAYAIARRLIADGKSPPPERVADPETNLKSLLRN